MALLRYEPVIPEGADNEALLNPDSLFMEKIVTLILKEPRIATLTASRLLWSLYAMNYHNKACLLKL